MFKRIVVPVDFSKPSLRGLDYAVELGRDVDAEIILVHVVDHILYAGAGRIQAPGYEAASLVSEFVRESRRQLAKLTVELGKKRVRVRTVLEIGTPHVVILDAAQRLKADLIVLSTHGRTGLAHLLMGSVAERVVRCATCPVLTVHGLAARARSAARGRARSGRVGSAIAADKETKRARSVVRVY